MDLISRIYRNEHAADLRCCPECQIPLGYVCCPDSDMVTFLTSHCQECSCQVINIIPEFGIRSCVIQLRVSECILVREQFADLIENIRESQIDQSLLGPGIIPCPPVVYLEFSLLLGFICLHVACELGNDDVGIEHIP